jgi:hypothetical protein
LPLTVKRSLTNRFAPLATSEKSQRRSLED